ncbi:MAG: alpha/beta hydrolase [Alistipes sp.]|nr:alpha/beta hydrolase [Alistipes sp.]
MEWSDEVGSTVVDIAYGEHSAHKFDLYLPADSSREKYGLVVYLHAGGFTMGDKSGDKDILQWFCSKGYVAAGINYAIPTDEDTAHNVYSMSLDVQRAMSVVKVEAEKRGYPLDGMIIAGGSAGACLALIYAYRDADSSPIPVKAVISMVGPATFEPAFWMGLDAIDYSDEELAEAAAVWLRTMTGDDITPEMMQSGEYLDSQCKISAAMLVTERSVPTLCAYGALDKIVPYKTAEQLISALNRYGVKSDCIVFPRSGHGLHRDKECAKLLYEKIEEYLATYLPLE